MKRYTIVDDGQVRWYAETADLVNGLVSAGYTPDVYQGYDVVVEPEYDAHDRNDWGDDPYSRLCSYVGDLGSDAIPDTEAIEAMEQNPGAVGQHRFVVTHGLWRALWEAKP